MRLDAVSAERELRELAAEGLEGGPDRGLAVPPAREQHGAAAAGAADLPARGTCLRGHREQSIDRRSLGDVRVHQLLALERFAQQRAEPFEVPGLDLVAHLVRHRMELLHPDDRVLASLFVHADLCVAEAEICSDWAGG